VRVVFVFPRFHATRESDKTACAPCECARACVPGAVRVISATLCAPPPPC
jgi:hypothetical protein